MAEDKMWEWCPDVEERMVRELEEDIIFGRLEPGTRLTEDTLLERFGGTRHFVRRALVRLEKLGILVLRRNRGAAVRSFSAEEVNEIYEVREMLQRQAALKIALPSAPELVRALEGINDRYREAIEAGDLRGIHELNDRFHLTMFAACGNGHLCRLVQEYMDITLPIRAKNLANPELLSVSYRQHDLMIKYLQGRDSWQLAELCVDHLRPSKEDYLRRLAEIAQASQKTVRRRVSIASSRRS